MADQCNIADCESAQIARGLCVVHYRKDYYAKNKEKITKRNAEWRSKNPEYWKKKNPELKRQADQRYAAKNRARRAENERLRRIVRAEEISAYRRSPAGRDAARRATHARRARERGVESESFSDTDMLEFWGSDCHICGFAIDLRAPRHVNLGDGWEFGLHRDHVIPLSKGGHNTLDNSKPAHALCNLKKSSI